MTRIESQDPQTSFTIFAEDTNPNVAINEMVEGGGTGAAFALKKLVDKAKSSIDVLDFGFINDRVFDNSPAFALMMTYLKTLVVRPSIFFPAGFYLFSSQPKFDLPCMKVYGAGMGASWIVCDFGVMMNFPNPTLYDIGISPQASSSTNVGLDLRNCWQANIHDVEIAEFQTGLRMLLDDEGEELIPGNGPGSFPVRQFGTGGRHSSWPWLDEFVRDGLTTTEHWGSRISLSTLNNIHIQGRVPSSTLHTGITLENTLADPAADYDDFNSLSGSSGQGVFFTGITISRGHLFCNGINIHVGGGVHGVTKSDIFLDSKQEAIRLDYGAQTIQLNQLIIDQAAGGAAIPWQPGTVYVVDDIVRVGDRQYKCITGGTSVLNVNHNGLPNSEWVGWQDTMLGHPVADSANPENLIAQAKVFGLDLSNTNDMQVFIQDVEVIDGFRWINMAVFLDTPAGSTSTLTIRLADPGLAVQIMPAIAGNVIQAQVLFQSRDPKGVEPSEVKGFIQGYSSSGSASGISPSPGVDIDSLAGYAQGRVVTYTEAFTLAGGTVARSTLNLNIKFSSTQAGYFPFRIARPQINIGATLGSYVRTTGRGRSRWQDGPQGTATGIADGTVTWDFDGTPIAAIIAPRAAWESIKSDTRGEIRLNGSISRFAPALVNAPEVFYNVVLPNPTNSNNDPTTISD